MMDKCGRAVHMRGTERRRKGTGRCTFQNLQCNGVRDLRRGRRGVGAESHTSLLPLLLLSIDNILVFDLSTRLLRRS